MGVPRTILLSVVVLLSFVFCGSARCASSVDAQGAVNDAVARLVQFCTDSKGAFDESAAAILADYALSAKRSTEYNLPRFQGAAGVYYEFDTKITFPRFMDYSYTSLVPSVITRPSSLRYSLWTGPAGETGKLPGNWKAIPPGGPPRIIRGIQHDSNTPDLTTGVHYEYDLKRVLILFNHNGKNVLISVSKQIGPSNVGKKGLILNDNDWSYCYSKEIGSSKTGLGWVKSYIYDYVSVGVYVETATSPVMVRTAFFQWIRGGWSGINFIQAGHIMGGMKRFARNFKTVLESPLLPGPERIAAVYQGFLNMPGTDLVSRYATLRQGVRSAVTRAGKTGKCGADESAAMISETPRDQMVEELMLEYLKSILGKLPVSGAQVSHSALPPPS